jgi:membrane fusion protein, multidrug efflux system
MKPQLTSFSSLTWAASGALLLALQLSGCGNEQAAQAAAGAGAPPAMPVTAAEVITRTVAEQREFSGMVEAVEQAQLRPRVSGYIERVAFEPGSLVKKGDVLFVIDQRAYQAEVARTEASAASSQAKQALAQTEWARAKRLLAENAISQRDHDERAANARQLEAAARADQAAVQSARLNLEWTTVRAPFSGRVGKAEVTEGNLVDGQTVLTTLVSHQPMYISFNGDETTYLQLGQLVRQNPQALKLHYGLSNEQGFPREGRLAFVDNQIDPKAGTVRMRAVVDNKDGLLTPGLFAKVQISADTTSGGASAMVAERAIGTDQNRKFVYVLNVKNQAEYRMVQLGSTVGSLKVVTSGLKAGERVVVDGLQRVRPGAPLAPKMVPMDAPAASEGSAKAPS